MQEDTLLALESRLSKLLALKSSNRKIKQMVLSQSSSLFKESLAHSINQQNQLNLYEKIDELSSIPWQQVGYDINLKKTSDVNEAINNLATIKQITENILKSHVKASEQFCHNFIRQNKIVQIPKDVEILFQDAKLSHYNIQRLFLKDKTLKQFVIQLTQNFNAFSQQIYDFPVQSSKEFKNALRIYICSNWEQLHSDISAKIYEFVRAQSEKEKELSLNMYFMLINGYTIQYTKEGLEFINNLTDDELENISIE
ncbi:Hypothetical_protein [Hexamita inflata]|uniref:Hypothetical_protein n=1 Tax=Hexamita inflata TaxID=28002 RepID=A0AA86P3Y9_9EUKA|nr:Hypothetical protein HINF_LOCUS17407 [Hexamita inflata]